MNALDPRAELRALHFCMVICIAWKLADATEWAFKGAEDIR